MKQTRKDRELIAVDELFAAEKARQDSEMHRLYEAFLENNELGIEEAEELLKNVKKSQSCSCSKNICVGEKCSKNIMVSAGEKQNAVDVRKKTVETGWCRDCENLALCFGLCLLKCVSCNIVDMNLAENV